MAIDMDKIMGATPELRRMYLAQRQSLPLTVKVALSIRRIREWYEAHNGMVYVAFSGGKDSTALLHLVRSLYPEVPAVFADTGLEFPEIREFVKTIENVIWVKPKKSFKKVLEDHGYPVVSKQVSRYISDVQNPTDKNVATVTLRLTGIKGDGTKGAAKSMIPQKWRFLIDAPFKISDQCCNHIKKQPLKEYAKTSKRVPFIGTMASDSEQRERSYIKTGCNSFKTKSSTPLAFWLETDIWDYLKVMNNIPYCSVYDNGEKRTGCVFCMFGCDFDKERFVRLKRTHPYMHRYCMEILGMAEVLDFMGLPH